MHPQDQLVVTELYKQKEFFRTCWESAEQQCADLEGIIRPLLEHLDKYGRIVTDLTFGNEAEQARHLIANLRGVLDSSGVVLQPGEPSQEVNNA